MEDDYEEDMDLDEEEKGEGLILSIGEDGKAEIHKPEEYVQVLVTEMELIQEFLNKNKKEFYEFIDSKKGSTSLDNKK